MISFREPPQFTVAHQKTLRAQTIDESRPGAIVRDFETLLCAVGDNDWPVSGVLRLPPDARIKKARVVEKKGDAPQ